MAEINAAVDICNLALSHLGQKPISGIDSPETQAEAVCALHYNPTRRRLLRDWVWNCAKKRVTLSRTGTPEFDFTDAYALPNDFVRFLSVGGEYEVDQERDYDIEGSTLLINNDGAASAKMRYIYDLKDVKKMDASFIDTLALLLAVRMSYAFTLKKGLRDELRDMLKEELPKAVTVDGQERPPRRIQRSKYLSARRTGSVSSVADPRYEPYIDS